MRRLALVPVLFVLAFSASAEPAADTVTLGNCLLSLAEEAQVPAQEAGVLTKVPVREGQQVATGDLLAQIDDQIPQRQYDVAKFKLKVAEKQASDDVDVRYAEAAYWVAKKKLEKYLQANAKTPGTIPETEVDLQRLERDKFLLSYEKAKKDMAVAALQAKVSDAELQAADVNVKRRKLNAPLDAVVVELSRHEGEWVEAGGPVMRLVRVDLLRVEGFLNATKHRASEVQGRPVQVTVTLAHGQRETFQGKIIYVKPLVEAGGDFLVRAEVQNRKEGGAWVLSPGMSAEMTIQLK
ncbi:MAG: HlyD family efflux transporter periplasmic adaptor subunit [Planctomycetaceae bacterium]|nr:HlyD family efflux transporter periplasmic adaptor subunit [Planctomycetaceae bacterium]